jgi:putative DNA primase/helicase
MCGGKDRWRFDDKDGRGSWICNQCGAGDGFHLLQYVLGCDFLGAADYVKHHAGKYSARPASQPMDTEKIRRLLRQTWDEAKRIEPGDPVSLYLASRCGQPMPDVCGLRYHASLVYKHDDGSITRHPAMLAQVIAGDGSPVTIHRTYLTADGKKADVTKPRKLMPRVQRVENAAIRLSKPLAGWLGVAEGIETALCASLRFQVATWACISAFVLESFKPPTGIKLVSIFGDNDMNYTGQASAYRLARRLASQAIECKVIIPERSGTDFADPLP